MPNTSPAGPSSSGTGGLWDTLADIERYDITLLSCEGAEHRERELRSARRVRERGGRVFASHYHYAFFFDDATNTNSTYFPNVANWTSPTTRPTGSEPGPTSTGRRPTHRSTRPSRPRSRAAPPSPRAGALHWLGSTSQPRSPSSAERRAPDHRRELRRRRHGGERLDRVGAVERRDPREHAVLLVGHAVRRRSRRRRSAGILRTCRLQRPSRGRRRGRLRLHHERERVVYSGTTPTGCTVGKLHPDEDAIEFILFDLSSCVTPVTAYAAAAGGHAAPAAPAASSATTTAATTAPAAPAATAQVKGRD